MRVDTALLCDAVTVREGLLHILGGGITHGTRDEFPAPLGVQLALRVLLHPTEIERPHGVEILLQDADGAQVTKAQIAIQLPPDMPVPPGQEASLPIAWTFPAQPPLPHPGQYSFEVLVAGVHQVSVPFTVVTQVEAEQGGESE